MHLYQHIRRFDQLLTQYLVSALVAASPIPEAGLLPYRDATIELAREASPEPCMVGCD
jgi:hypothetical protein